MSEEKIAVPKKITNRLPSLKEPRDLTLGGIVKRKFVPTIPAPKSKKGNVESAAPDTNKSEIKSESKNISKDKYNKKDFKGQQKNLIQLKSIFDEGPKEEFRAKRESIGRSFSDRESTSSAIKIEYSKSKINQNGDNKELLDKLLKDDFIAEDCSGNESDEDSKSKTETKPINLPFKKEAPDKSNVFPFESLFKDEFILIQHPDIFPGYPPTDPSILQNKNTESMEEKRPLASFSEGCIGKLRFHKNGQITLCLNNVTLDVVPGLPSGLLQEVVMTDIKEGAETGEMVMLGEVNQKLILLPNIDNMLDSINVN